MATPEPPPSLTTYRITAPRSFAPRPPVLFIRECRGREARHASILSAVRRRVKSFADKAGRFVLPLSRETRARLVLRVDKQGCFVATRICRNARMCTLRATTGVLAHSRPNAPEAGSGHQAIEEDRRSQFSGDRVFRRRRPRQRRGTSGALRHYGKLERPSSRLVETRFSGLVPNLKSAALSSRTRCALYAYVIPRVRACNRVTGLESIELEPAPSMTTCIARFIQRQQCTRKRALGGAHRQKSVNLRDRPVAAAGGCRIEVLGLDKAVDHDLVAQ